MTSQGISERAVKCMEWNVSEWQMKWTQTAVERVLFGFNRARLRYMVSCLSVVCDIDVP